MTYFSTASLDVRRSTVANIAGFSAYRADPAVGRYQSWDGFTHAQGEALVESMRHLEPGTPGEWFHFALEDRDRGVLVGDLACKVNDLGPREMAIGFTLARHEQGRGHATEAVVALLDHAFVTMRLHRVVAVTDARHTAAAALLTRLGMRQVAHFVDNVSFKGAWGSELLLAKLAREHLPAPRPADLGSSTAPHRPACSQEAPHDHR
jgi:RimJ/RimL family protein N-acetyltransferase